MALAVMIILADGPVTSQHSLGTHGFDRNYRGGVKSNLLLRSVVHERRT